MGVLGGAEEIGLLSLLDGFLSRLSDFSLAMLLTMVGGITKLKAETAVCVSVS